MHGRSSVRLRESPQPACPGQCLAADSTPVSLFYHRLAERKLEAVHFSMNKSRVFGVYLGTVNSNNTAWRDDL